MPSGFMGWPRLLRMGPTLFRAADVEVRDKGLVVLETIALKVHATPERVFLFLCEYDKNYTEVSEDHLERVTTVKNADPDHPDAGFYFRQLSPISGREQKIRGGVTRVGVNRYIGTEFLFPTSLFLKSVEEIIEPADDGCLLTTNMRFTFAAKLMKHARHKVVEHIRAELEETRAVLEKK